MRLVATKSVEPGTKLGKPIFNDNGQVLLFEGVELTERVLERLLNLGISFIYIYDERTEDIVVEDVITDETRHKAIKFIKREFQSISNDLKLNMSINCDYLSRNFSEVVKSILSDIKQKEDALALLSDVYVYDNYIFTHSLNVTVYTLALAVEVGFTEKQLMEIGLGALLHDVGKMAIPSEILNKPGRLTREEFDVIKTHPKVGFDMLKNLPNISLVTAHCALQHHERMDGTGYPQGLTNESIHLYAKLIGIADVFDAVTSHRVYRRPMLPHEALELLYSGVNTQFDKRLVEAFSRAVAVYPVGVTVTLNDEREAIVIKQNKQLSSRPVVRVISEKGKKLESSYDINLMQQINITIVEIESTQAAPASSKKE
ncbi:HD-GYP domain-containing protein [Halalkalibacter urbisdiaboli]|uniref:HD-GYP domain-containing protein n=1 Tax=Halalkalibacter urbisdiaboli TaxID=1960589 RepID=UPI000B454EF4|nr:HD-GYP domain-containing protein [Halalkalibacter urbisdiaboli]